MKKIIIHSDNVDYASKMKEFTEKKLTSLGTNYKMVDYNHIVGREVFQKFSSVSDSLKTVNEFIMTQLGLFFDSFNKYQGNDVHLNQIESFISETLYSDKNSFYSKQNQIVTSLVESYYYDKLKYDENYWNRLISMEIRDEEVIVIHNFINTDSVYYMMNSFDENIVSIYINNVECPSLESWDYVISGGEIEDSINTVIDDILTTGEDEVA